jgi:hypothetical protein
MIEQHGNEMQFVFSLEHAKLLQHELGERAVHGSQSLRWRHSYQHARTLSLTKKLRAKKGPRADGEIE